MGGKSEQLQIRVSRGQKAALRRLAAASGLDVSAYVLSRVLPSESTRLAAVLHALGTTTDHRFLLAELNDFLHACPPMAFASAVANARMTSLSPFLQNYVAAMVEQAADQKGVTPPAWVHEIAPLALPHFATPMRSLRMHLIRNAPVPFKRRNIFVDAGVGDRV